MVDAPTQGRLSFYLKSNLIFNLIHQQTSKTLKEKFGRAPHAKELIQSSEFTEVSLTMASLTKKSKTAFIFARWIARKSRDQVVCQQGFVFVQLFMRRHHKLKQKTPETSCLAQPLKCINLEEFGIAVYQGMTGEGSALNPLSKIVSCMFQRMLIAG